MTQDQLDDRMDVELDDAGNETGNGTLVGPDGRTYEYTRVLRTRGPSGPVVERGPWYAWPPDEG